MATNDKDTGRDTSGDTGGEWIDYIKQVVFWAGVAKDVYDVSKAIHTDCTETENKRPGKGTIEAILSVALSRTVSEVGSNIGEEIGHSFGGVGAESGKIVGGLVGSHAGSLLAKEIVDRSYASDV
jgi:hypothetical protein